jgi:hypothetical protein
VDCCGLLPAAGLSGLVVPGLPLHHTVLLLLLLLLPWHGGGTAKPAPLRCCPHCTQQLLQH